MHADRYCNSDHISKRKHFNKWKEISNILVICSQMPDVSSTFYIFCFYFCMVNRQRKGFYSERLFKNGALTIRAPSTQHRFESSSQKWKKGTINLFCPGMESSTYLLIANGTINLLIILMGLISIYIFNDPNGKVFVQQRQFNSERQKRNYLRINERKRLTWLQA